MGVELVEKDKDIVTPMYVEMYVALEMLHCTHEEFLKLPKLEKQKIKTYLKVKGLRRREEKEEFESEIHAERMKLKAPKANLDR